MKTLSQFINEVFLNTIKKTGKAVSSFKREVLYNNGRKWDPETSSDKTLKKLSKVPSTGHHIYSSYDKNTGYHYFHAYDPEKKRSTITVQGRLRNGVLHNLYLASHDENTLPAHKFYSHLLNKEHVTALASKSQSPGAKSVWGKLAKEKGVGIHGWHKGKPVNVKVGEDETHDVKKGDPSIRDMELVAHKKDK